MARLNEPPDETIESLKRRFIRQNRELARVNSNQSVKIRTLETEISKLLSENVLLRERTIQLETDLEDVRTRDIRSGVDTIRNKMDSKMREINSLLIQLADLNKKPRRRTSQYIPAQRIAAQSYPKGSSITNCPTNSQEGQLPTIVEGKYFPRKTLEVQEIESILAAEKSDSSDIGPPPTTSLGSKEHKEEQAPQVDVSASKSVEADLTELLLANFETRRRRRNSHLRQTASSNGNDEAEGLLVPPLRIGSKRKLSIRDHKEHEPEVMQSTDSGILSSIREAKEAKSPLKQALNPGDIRLQPKPDRCPKITEKRLNNSDSSPRKVLGIRPVNTDPVVSPKKINRQNLIKDKEKDIKASADGASKETYSRGIAKNKPKSVIDIPVALQGPPPSATDIVIEPSKHDPKTPAAMTEVFSPESAQETGPKADPDITARVTASEGLIGPGRVSRRARAVVSYTEPNLVSKMRRPSKGLVDAVIAGQGRKSGSTSEEFSQALIDVSENDLATRVVHLQRENSYDKGWKSVEQERGKDHSRPEPESPLRSKETTESERGVPRAVLSKKRSRAGSTSSASGIDTASSLLEKDFTNLDIFDVQDSPPAQKERDSSARTKSQARRQTISNVVSSSNSTSDRPRSAFSQRPVSAPQGLKQVRSVSSMSSARGYQANGAVKPSTQGLERRKSMMI